MRKKYIISGIGIGDSGTSKFLEKLLAYNCNYIVVTPGRHLKLKTLLKRKAFGKFFIGLLYYIANLTSFRIRCFFIRYSEIILIHPQSIGLRTSMRLVKRNKLIKYFVLDSFLFCKQSYNYNYLVGGECIKCISEKPDPHCKSFPLQCSDKLHKRFRLSVTGSSNVEFFFQNENHRKLHQQVINKKPSSVIGLETSDEFFGDLVPLGARQNYIIYHGDLMNAKGRELLAMLVAGLPDIRFVVPGNDHLFGLSPNVEMHDVRWQTGLKELVQNATVVLCLSTWSAPIETALTKSIRSNGVVVVADLEYAFCSEFCDRALLRISMLNPIKSCRDVRRLYDSRELQTEAIEQSNSQLSILNYQSINTLLKMAI